MGYGDWVMCTAQVKELHEFDGRPVYVIGRGNRPQWSEVFENNPRITRRPIRNAQTLINGSGLRPYIASKSPQRWEWKKWRIAAGEIYLTKEEKEFGKQFAGKIVIEPNTKVADGNKAWIWDRWQQVAVVCGVRSERRGRRTLWVLLLLVRLVAALCSLFGKSLQP